MSDYSELKRLADAATPGPWTVHSEDVSDKSAARAEFEYQLAHTEPFLGRMFMLNGGGKCPAMTGCGPTSEANAEFIAAANPATVLDMISRLTALEAENAKLREQALAMTPRPISDGLELMRKAFSQWDSPYWYLYSPADNGASYGLVFDSWRGKTKLQLALYGECPVLLAAQAMAAYISSLHTGGE